MLLDSHDRCVAGWADPLGRSGESGMADEAEWRRDRSVLARRGGLQAGRHSSCPAMAEWRRVRAGTKGKETWVLWHQRCCFRLAATTRVADGVGSRRQGHLGALSPPVFSLTLTSIRSRRFPAPGCYSIPGPRPWPLLNEDWVRSRGRENHRGTSEGERSIPRHGVQSKGCGNATRFQHP